MRNRTETINLPQCETEMFATEIEEAQAATQSATEASPSLSLRLSHNASKQSNWRTNWLAKCNRSKAQKTTTGKKLLQVSRKLPAANSSNS